jgi:integrase
MQQRINIESTAEMWYSKAGCRCRLNKQGGILFGRTRYQEGSLRLEERKRGPAVWVYRWWEKNTEGKPVRRKAQLGSLEEYPNESRAQAAADAVRLTINEKTPRQQLKEITIATLVQHYREHEMPDVFSNKRPSIGTVCEHEEGRKSYSTQETYEGYLKKWIVPRWGSYRLGDVKAVQVEQWLKTVPLARGSRAKIRNIMSALYSHAIRWEWTDKNPITQVRQSAKRSKIPTVLSVEEIQRLFSSIKEPCRTAVILDAVSGLRVGELLGLKWEDVRFDQLELNVTRSVSRQVVTPCKTEVSRKPVPMNAEIAEMLWRWRQEAPYNQPDDWIFASPHRAGIQPYWPGSLYRAHLKPALLKAGISVPVGWHTLRHSFGTLMKANGEDIKTIQELLRHATFKVTADTYTQAVTPVKRDAQARIAKLIMADGSASKAITPTLQ